MPIAWTTVFRLQVAYSLWFSERLRADTLKWKNNSRKGASCTTIIIDDAGSGDLLFGVVVGAYRSETREFKYGVVEARYFQSPSFRRKQYLRQTSRTVFQLLERLELKTEEPLLICRGFIFDSAVKDLEKKYGSAKIRRVKVTGEPQTLTETAYLDEIRNLGYEPIEQREEKRGKSFFHMMRWLKKHPEKIKYAKTGWPRLQRYRLFKPDSQTW